MSRLQLAIDQIVFARNYTLGLLEQTPPTDWFRQPPGGVTHVGWQVGHIAFAEYRLALWRIRGPQPQDEALFSQEFLRLFGPNSVPDMDAAKYPAPAQIRSVLDRAHEQALRERRSRGRRTTPTTAHVSTPPRTPRATSGLSGRINPSSSTTPQRPRSPLDACATRGARARTRPAPRAGRRAPTRPRAGSGRGE